MNWPKHLSVTVYETDAIISQQVTSDYAEEHNLALTADPLALALNRQFPPGPENQWMVGISQAVIRVRRSQFHVVAYDLPEDLEERNMRLQPYSGTWTLTRV